MYLFNFDALRHSSCWKDWFSPGQSKHPVFGKITKGMDVVTKISKVKTRDDNPVNPIKMNSIKIL